jgi:hypothetical protein
MSPTIRNIRLGRYISYASLHRSRNLHAGEEECEGRVSNISEKYLKDGIVMVRSVETIDSDAGPRSKEGSIACLPPSSLPFPSAPAARWSAPRALAAWA